MRRRGARLTVTWKPVAGAKRYELSVTSAASQRFASTRGRRTTFANVPLTSPAKVTVRAVDDLRPVACVRSSERSRAERA